MATPLEASPVFTLKLSGVSAKAQVIDGIFTVLKGSTAKRSNWPGLQALVDSGQLMPGSGNLLEFTSDTPFHTASDATQLIVGTNSTSSSRWFLMGPDGTETTFGEWRQKMRGGQAGAALDRLEEAASWLRTQGDNLDQQERRYKLAGAEAVRRQLEGFLADGSLTPVKLNLQPQNKLNLLGWRTVNALNALVHRFPAVFREAVRQLWERDSVEASYVNAFWDTLQPALTQLSEGEQRPLSGQGTRASIVSYLLFIADPTGHPFYRPTFGGAAVEWLDGGKNPLSRASVGALLLEYVARCRGLLARFTAAGVELRDMLDLQGALFLVKIQYLNGTQAAASQPDALTVEFRAFQVQPAQRLRCEIRRVRAAQIRELLAVPEQVSLDVFNREIWRFHKMTRLDGAEVTREVFNDLSDERAAELTQALFEDRLILQGNYTWGSGSSVFGPSLALTAEQKTALVQQAVQILNDPELSAPVKVQQLEALPGFGPNVSSGLVSLFHPDELALYNQRSLSALHTLKYDTSSPELFQSSAATLRDRVGAEDFLELDWFLYTRGPAERSWWVNQGQTYTEERDGGYVWASSENGRKLQHHENVARLRPGDRIVHYANQAIRAISVVTEPAVQVDEERRSTAIPSKRRGHFAPVTYQELSTPISLGELPEEWRQVKPGPFDKNGDVMQGYLFPLDSAVYDQIVARLTPPAPTTPVPYDTIRERIAAQGLRIGERTLRRYHLALQSRGFVILSGVSGTGKTWLAQAYARASGAAVQVFPVAPNWTSNEDLLGFYSPLDGGQYHHTAFSRFLLSASEAYLEAQAAGHPAQPYHLILDEMNLARVEYYFAQFLSKMELRARGEDAVLDLGPHLKAALPPNVVVIGTVNVDETTHDFADKVYDRAQLIELEVTRGELATHLGDHAQAAFLLRIWDAVHPAAPFAYRVLDEITAYQQAAAVLGTDQTEALDDALLQKVLPKLRGTDPKLLEALATFLSLTEGFLPLSHAKAQRMYSAGTRHGFVSFH